MNSRGTTFQVSRPGCLLPGHTWTPLGTLAGAPGGIRTHGLWFRRPLLCPLSYGRNQYKEIIPAATTPSSHLGRGRRLSVLPWRREVGLDHFPEQRGGVSPAFASVLKHHCHGNLRTVNRRIANEPAMRFTGRRLGRA